MLPEDWLRFIQMGPFTAKWSRLRLSDDDLRHLEMSIMMAPGAAPVIRGTAGLRKMRFAPPSWRTGKSGALRVCYVFFEEYSIVVLVGFYGKNEQSDLTAEQRNEMSKLIREIRQYLESPPRRFR